MGFSGKLLLAYLLLFCLDAIAFARGRRRKKWIPFAAVTAVMAAGIAALGYLWITSPM